MARLTLKAQRAPAQVVPAERSPIARVLVDTGVSHLDAPYDYLVPEKLSVAATPGVRVRVRFAGRLVDGWLLERLEQSDFSGKLRTLSSVVSPEVLLTPQLRTTFEEIAARFAGSLWDVVRTAIPPRHAKTEAMSSDVARPQWNSEASIIGYQLLDSFSGHLNQGPRAVLAHAPGSDHFHTIAALVHRAAADGLGVLVVVPDERDLSMLHAALKVDAGVVVLRANLAPAERYRRYLRLSRGVDRVCIGTRSAIFAPVANLGLIIVWDDGDESHYEQHSPGWNSRDVAAIRAHLERTALLLAGYSVSVDAARLIENGWAKRIGPDRIKDMLPRVAPADDEAVRVSSRTWKTIKEASEVGPVLLSVARRGYFAGLQCQQCKSPAVCSCGGPVVQDQRSPAYCQLCGALHEKYVCGACGGIGLRSVGVGIERTIEEIGKAFPQRVIRHSTGERPIAQVPRNPSIVVSTQGVEPVVPGGYEAVVIFDALATLYRPHMRAEEEARRRWFNTAALTRPGGSVVITGDGSLPAIQSLIRWDPAGAARREFEQRLELHLPPAWEFGVVDVDEVSEELLAALAECGEVLGPIPQESGMRLIVRAPKGIAPRLKELAAQRSARSQSTRVRINPFSV